MGGPDTPGELHIDAKWDKLIDSTLKRVVYGSLIGAAAGLLLAREIAAAHDSAR
jgi:hypothetical protein